MAPNPVQRGAISLYSAGMQERDRSRGYHLKGQIVAAPALARGLHVVATPIGNLRDVTIRALEVLAGADLVACEDTRVTRKLLDHYGIAVPLTPYHDHNAAEARPKGGSTSLGIAVIDISSGAEWLIGTPGSKGPAFDPGNPDRFVYTSQDNGVSEIHLYTVSTGIDLPITNVGTGWRQSPRIDGDRIVWMDKRTGDGIYQAYAYDLVSQSERRVSSREVYGPHVSGTKAVWQDGVSHIPLGLQVFDFTTSSQQVFLAGDQRAYAVCPNISGDWISWYQYGYFQSQEHTVFAYNIRTQELRQLNSSAGITSSTYIVHSCPAMSDGWVFWRTQRRGSDAILAHDLRKHCPSPPPNCNIVPTQVSNPLAFVFDDVEASPQWVVWTSNPTRQIFIRPWP